jgi:hypothetical protein
MLMVRGKAAAFALALFASLCVVAVTLLVFFAWTYPANELTDNWTSIPDNWEQLRHHWEYAHAANALNEQALWRLSYICSCGRRGGGSPRPAGDCPTDHWGFANGPITQQC